MTTERVGGVFDPHQAFQVAAQLSAQEGLDPTKLRMTVRTSGDKRWVFIAHQAGVAAFIMIPVLREEEKDEKKIGKGIEEVLNTSMKNQRSFKELVVLAPRFDHEEYVFDSHGVVDKMDKIFNMVDQEEILEILEGMPGRVGDLFFKIVEAFMEVVENLRNKNQQTMGGSVDPSVN